MNPVDLKRKQRDLAVACRYAWYENARRHLKEGVCPNFHDEETGNTPLQTAVYGANVELTELLLQHGADINRVGAAVADSPLPWAWTPLMVAYNNPKMLALLLQNGANPDIQNQENRMTVMHLSAGNNHVPATMLLLKYGARRDLVSDAGRTPFQEAVVRRSQSVVEAWQAYEAAEKARAAVDAGVKVRRPRPL